MDHEPPAADPKAGERPRAWQEGWTEAARGSLSPNPYAWSAPEFPAWFAGYLARHQPDRTAAPTGGTAVRPDGPTAVPVEPPAAAAPPRDMPADRPASVASAAAAAEAKPPQPAPGPGQKLAIPSPGFATRRPTLSNAELIPPHVHRAMDEVWSQAEFAAREITFTVQPDAWVAHEGLVFDNNLEPHPGTTAGFTEADIAAARAAIEEDRAAGRVWYHAGSHVLAKTRAPNDYGHFLTEGFPRAAITHRLMQEGDLHVILHRCSGNIMQLAYSALNRLGITLDQIEVTGAEPHQFGVLIVVDGLESQGRYMSPLVVEEVGKLAADVAPGPYRKVYVKRGATGTRTLVNEPVLLERLMREGYVAIDPGEMTLREQIAAFAGAQRVVGVYGAGMANIAFCPPGSRVGVIAPATMPDASLWFIAQHRRQEYFEIRCPELPGDAEPSWNRSIAIARTDIEFLASW